MLDVPGDRSKVTLVASVSTDYTDDYFVNMERDLFPSYTKQNQQCRSVAAMSANV